MNIGIDFDNTIARYDNLFKEIALSEGFIDKSWAGSGKRELSNYLLELPDGETTWMKLQGLIYGKYMHRAELMPGVANFLLQCRLRDYPVFIVSHKTKFGHFDPEKIPLRKEALKWMQIKQFFDPQYFGVNKDNIHFANTREEKVDKIAQLNCTFFIDDLPEVFAEPLFPNKTIKILFDKFSYSNFDKTINVFQSWSNISNHILGDTLTEDIMLWLNSFFHLPKEKLLKISGRGNSQIYELTADDTNKYAVKVYPDKSTDNRERLKIEYAAITLLNNEGFSNIPDAVSKDEDLNIGVYSWIDGSEIQSVGQRDLDQAIAFIRSLNILSKNNPSCFHSLASGACLSAKSLLKQIELRLKRLQFIAINSQSLNLFLKNIFTPLWERVKSENLILWPESSRDRKLDAKYRILSPSDFGFHNALQENDGKLTFIDFDYFGWDDPVKLTADFLWHPAMDFNSAIAARWKKAMVEQFTIDPDFKDRLHAAMPLFGLRWVMIILNEFLPGFAERRKNAGETDSYDLKKSQSIQLMKAKQYCKRVEKLLPQLMIA